MSGTPPSHRRRIVEEFTLQATPFAEAPAIRDEEALRLLVETSGAGPADDVLDVACGPGIVACAFASAARRVVGIDLTPAMVDLARKLAAEKGLANVEWRVSDILPLPVPDGSFPVVVCRYSFHHFPDPGKVLAEMARACAPGGRVAVADMGISDDPAKAEAFNRMERLRDPSHVRSLTPAELERLFAGARLPIVRRAAYRLDVDLEESLARSFPAPGGAEEIRRMFAASLGHDGLGAGARREGGKIRFHYPIEIFVGVKGPTPPAGAPASPS